MECRNGGLVSDNVHGISAVDDQNRRTAGYKPNIWNYDLLAELATENVDEKHEKIVEKLMEDVKCSLSHDAVDTIFEKLELVDHLEKLGLAYLLENEIKNVLETVAASNQNLNVESNLYATALCFSLLRKHGYHASQDMFKGLEDINTEKDVKAVLKFFEASHLAFEGEDILDKANENSRQHLKNVISSKLDNDTCLARLVSNTLEDPYNVWYNVKTNIQYHQRNSNSNSQLISLAKHNFNMIQATHQKEVKELSSWWRKLDLEKRLPFLRNRIIESYVCAVGIVFEPKYGSLRKWLAKSIILILMLDDVYDVYGTLPELEKFTIALDRWDNEGTQTLPECMKICLQTVYDTNQEIASELEKEYGWNSVSPHLQKAWTNLCKSLLVEAQWYNKKYTPTLEEYTDNGWYSSSGPLLAIHIFFALIHPQEEAALNDLLKSTEDHEKHTALIFRLCNDLGTSAVEVERGDAASSILCIMKEKCVSEEAARNQIKPMISNAWKKMNYNCITQPPMLQKYIKYSTNIARVAHVVYHNGDGISNADGMTRNQVMDLLSDQPL